MPAVFSVVTPTYNSEQYLEETIESVITQRGNFFIDYVILDNCSTDGTIALLERYNKNINNGHVKCNCLGVTFSFFSEQDTGMYDALSKGLRLCRGNYISYINSDDFYLPNAFSTVAKVFEENNVKWLTGIPSLYNEYGAIIAADASCVFNRAFIRSGVYGKYLPHVQQESTFWKRDLLDSLNDDELARLKYAGDFYLWCKFAEKNKLYTVNSQLSGFRIHAGNMSSNMSAYNKEFESLIVNKLSVLDYSKIYIYKLLFKIFGSNLLKYCSGVINVH